MCTSNDYLQKKANVEQPPHFESPYYPDHDFKKALCGLKQAPIVW